MHWRASREALVAKRLPDSTRYAENKRDNILRFPARLPPCHGAVDSRDSFHAPFIEPGNLTLPLADLLQTSFDIFALIFGLFLLCTYTVGVSAGIYWIIVSIVGKFA